METSYHTDSKGGGGYYSYDFYLVGKNTDGTLDSGFAKVTRDEFFRYKKGDVYPHGAICIIEK